MERKLLFQDGKKRALTLSYDDGTIHDRRLVDILNKYGIKCTFNLNSGLLGKVERKLVRGYDTDFSRITGEEVKTLYQGHEVASHTCTHPSFVDLPGSIGAAEVLKDRELLEALTGGIVRGFAYPYGAYNDRTETMLSVYGIAYARTVVSTNAFWIPENFLEWHPTCHHDSPELMNLARTFCEEEEWFSRLFYVWGHSYEFAQKDNWQKIEDFCSYMQQYQEIVWMASNVEIMDYIKAYRALYWSADGKRCYNPGSIRIWFEADGQICQIGSGETLILE